MYVSYHVPVSVNVEALYKLGHSLVVIWYHVFINTNK